MEKVRDILYGEHNPYKGFKKVAPDMQGWGSTDPVFEEVISTIKPRRIIEVGTWKGGSAIHMANLCKKYLGDDDFEIVCVDTFLGSVEHWDRSSIQMDFVNGRPDIYNKFMTNVIEHKLQNVITPFPVDSTNGALTLNGMGYEADLIYIDAGHDYNSVASDLTHYAPLLRAGGYLIGDDYHWPDIIQAAEDVFGADKVINKVAKFVWIR